MKNLNLTFYAFAGISSMPVTLLAGQFQPEKKSIDKQHPNIVLIVADDLGYGDLSCYGADAIQTPGMDRIANEGIRFTQGFCTAATSTPSRYSLLTGLYPWTNRDAKILPGNAAHDYQYSTGYLAEGDEASGLCHRLGRQMASRIR